MLRVFSFFGTWKHNRWKACLKLFPSSCKSLHTENSKIVSTNICISRHVRNGHLDLAQTLFDEMPIRSVVSWNIMISGYSKVGQYSEALELASGMHCSNVKLNEKTFSTLLSICAHSGCTHEGKQYHCLVLKSGLQIFELVGSALLYFYANTNDINGAKLVFDELHDKNDLLWSLMLVGYVKCNLMDDAFDLFRKIPTRDVVVWTTLISGYARSEHNCRRALELFCSMLTNGEVEPNEFTFDCVVRACGRLRYLRQGKVVHGILTKYGFHFDHSICGALILFYCQCEAVDIAKTVYDGMERPCLNASNALLEGLLLVGRINDAEEIFVKLREKNPVSYNLMLKGYAISGRIEESKKLFEKMTHKTLISSNTMITVYSRNGEIEKAMKLFESTKGEGNPVTWNSMISGYIQNHQHEEALRLYQTMCKTSVERSRSTFSVLLQACTCLGTILLGRSLHGHAIKTAFDSNVYVGTSLIDMYSKCGSVYDAKISFASVYSPNVAAYTALINGYVQHGLGGEAFLVFENMLKNKIVPNAATLLGILSACSRAGMVNEGMKIFHSMEKCYGVIPTLEHYACVVDLLGRSGHLYEAEELIRNMPIEADGVIWGALLNACWFWMDLELGESVAKKMLCLDPKAISAYVILSNIYAILGKWVEKIHVRRRLRSLKVKKDRGCSWIDVNNRIHVFSVGDRSHPNCNAIYATLEHILAHVNSIVQFDHVPRSVSEVSFPNPIHHFL
ncbi:pentatricopeptide repeat-containing protein At2g13600-like [Cucurbita maxima]|uniref:Pentatricopeptide repeat-containing protein At2g13600-like n=1 Tax=Cucurbita maxima TaxID=3661 RepID=A0A6J1K5J2_CUCMA|nr:pentatricopeptide repeat-containing protein At2g13600-like [Cucurbita maxima]XP_022995385.1 pentatricopeptide repeat-containing protein At2g13600-like [Cucurbita maxima]